MDSALSPREIQSRIRSGATVEEVAEEAGVGVEQVEPFAVPVLAELNHVIEVAMTCPIRRNADPGSHRSLGAVVSRVARAHSFDADVIEWRAWRHEDRTWAVEARWPATEEDAPTEATFRFDLRARHCTPENAGAGWLINEPAPRTAVSPRPRRTDPDLEPTLDLNDDLAVVRAVRNPPSEGDSQGEVPGMTSHDGVYDFIPSSSVDMDTLYEMLAGFQEDSVNIYEGLETPPVDAAGDDAADGQAAAEKNDSQERPSDNRSTGRRASGGRGRAKSQSSSSATASPKASSKETSGQDDPSQAALVEGEEEAPRTRRRKKSRRATIPSWDEIMFGGPTPHA